MGTAVREDNNRIIHSPVFPTFDCLRCSSSIALPLLQFPTWVLLFLGPLPSLLVYSSAPRLPLFLLAALSLSLTASQVNRLAEVGLEHLRSGDLAYRSSGVCSAVCDRADGVVTCFAETCFWCCCVSPTGDSSILSGGRLYAVGCCGQNARHLSQHHITVGFSSIAARSLWHHQRDTNRSQWRCNGYLFGAATVVWRAAASPSTLIVKNGESRGHREQRRALTKTKSSFTLLRVKGKDSGSAHCYLPAMFADALWHFWNRIWW